MKVIFNITENKNKATFQQEVVKINTSFNQTENIVKPKFQIGYYPLPVGLENYYTKNETDLLLENYYLKTETYSQDEVDSLFSNETLDAITDRGNTTENDIKVGGITTDYVQLDTTSTNTYNIGKVYWNETKGTYDFGLKNNVTLQLGQEQYVYGKAYSAISNGQLVMYRTSQGGHILFEPANFTQLSTNPDLIIGIATQDIALNEFGYITTFGEVNTLNTSSFADGNTLYFGIGNVLQNTVPSGSYFIIGRVNRSHATQGSIFVKPYFVDSNLESKSNKSDSYTASSSTTYASTKALVDGLATKLDKGTYEGTASDLVPYNGATQNVNIGAHYFESSQGFKKTGGTANQALTANGAVYDLTTKADLVDGKVPSSQLPSYVDDVLEFANLASFPAAGESGKIYIAIDTNITYRWTGTGYAEISASLALGETSSTAYRGDRGKIAFDHSQTIGNPHGTTKADIGLGNVDNTSDINKPVSTATQTALDLKVDKVAGKQLSTEDYTTNEKNKLAGIQSGAEVNVNADWNAISGDAYILNKPSTFTPSVHTHPISQVDNLQTTLDAKADLVNGLVPASQLPSFVNDVLEFPTIVDFPTNGETDKIYLAKDTNKIYRWSGSEYVQVNGGLALGETSETAYRGDRGKTAYDHSQTIGNPHGTTKGDIGLGNVDNTSDANKPISTATQNALNTKADLAVVDNIQIGGRNLLLNSDFNSNISEWVKLTGNELLYWSAESGGVLTCESWDVNGGFYRSVTASGSVSVGFDVKPFDQENGNYVVRVFLGDQFKEVPIHYTPDWKRYSVIFDNVPDGSKNIIFQILSKQRLFFDKLKVEKGNKATDWTPAPEDKQDRLQDVTGNIGVGKTDASATEKLDVNGNVKATSFIKSGGTSSQYLMADGSVSTLTNPITGTGTTNYLPKFTASGTIGNSLIYDNGTSVGIGTTSPDIFSRGYDTVIGVHGSGITKIELNGGTYSGIDFGQSGIRYGEINSSSTSFDLGSIGSIPFNLNVNGIYRMTITPSGNVGIGTTSPGAILDVNGALSSGKSIIRVTNSDTGNYVTIGAGIPGVTNAGMNLTLDGTSKMVISAGGNVGIGTTSPSEKLDVNGNVLVQGLLKLKPQTSEPTGVEGAIYYNSTTKKHYGFDGTTWNALY